MNVYENDVTDQYDIGVIRKLISDTQSIQSIRISEKNEHTLFVSYITAKQMASGLPFMLNRTAVVSKKVYNVGVRDKKIKQLMQNSNE